jgi:hypothetical protein
MKPKFSQPLGSQPIHDASYLSSKDRMQNKMGPLDSQEKAEDVLELRIASKRASESIGTWSWTYPKRRALARGLFLGAKK